MNVIITEAAWSDLRRIGGTIAEHSTSRAERFVDAIYDQCHELGTMPLAFALLPGREETGIRRRVHGNYLIFYRVNDDTVEILHILHGAMDYGSILFPEA